MMLDDLGQLLVDNDLAEGSTGFALKLGRLPEDPDRVVSLFEVPGRPPEPTPGLVPQVVEGKDPVNWVRYPTLQVRIRGAQDDYRVVREHLNSIFRCLHARINHVVGSCTYVHILALGDPLPLGRDKTDRPEFTQNFSTVIEETI